MEREREREGERAGERQLRKASPAGLRGLEEEEEEGWLGLELGSQATDARLRPQPRCCSEELRAPPCTATLHRHQMLPCPALPPSPPFPVSLRLSMIRASATISQQQKQRRSVVHVHCTGWWSACDRCSLWCSPPSAAPSTASAALSIDTSEPPTLHHPHHPSSDPQHSLLQLLPHSSSTHPSLGATSSKVHLSTPRSLCASPSSPLCSHPRWRLRFNCRR